MHKGQKGRTRTLGGTVVLGLLGLVAASSAGCDDNDTTDLTNGGSGGTAGRGGGGRGGSSAGTGGSSSAGVGGSGGGAQGGSAGGPGGAGGGGGSSQGGTAGTGGGVGDAGVDAALGDAGVKAARQLQIATDMCDKLEQVDGCEPPDDCVNLNLGTFTFIEGINPACEDEGEDWVSCMAAQPVTSFECSGDTAQYIAGTPPCDDEEAAFFTATSDSGESCED